MSKIHYFERPDGTRFHFRAPNSLIARQMAERQWPGVRYRGFKTAGRMNGGDAR